MPVIRGGRPVDHFTIIENAWLRDPRLSWKAKGLLAYIASHQVGYRLTRDQILAQATDGKDAVQAGLRELEEAGYLTRIRIRGEGGRIEGTVFRLGEPVDGVVEEPVDKPGADSPSDGKPGPGSDQGEHGVSAGGDQGGFSCAGEPAGKKTTPEKTREKTNSSASPRRGTRLPADFQVTEAMRAWYVENVGNAIDGWGEHAKFMDYWASVPGARGVKLDWPATWRNWMRTAMERAGRRPTSGAPSGAADKPRYPTAQERSQQHLSDFATLAKEAEDWIEGQGGDPNDGKLVFEVMERIKRERNDSAARTPGMYSGGNVIDGEAWGPREVTAGEAT